MNERIRQLAKQAGGHFFTQNLMSNLVQQRECIEFSDINIEKFAELIIRECLNIAQDRANFPGYPPNDVNYIIEEIKQHFGVEEIEIDRT
jgi:hypothetical protein